MLLYKQLLKQLEPHHILPVSLFQLGQSGLLILDTPGSKTLAFNFGFLLLFSARGSR